MKCTLIKHSNAIKKIILFKNMTTLRAQNTYYYLVSKVNVYDPDPPDSINRFTRESSVAQVKIIFVNLTHSH